MLKNADGGKTKKVKALMNNLPSSFRDSSGFMFKKNGSLYRYVSKKYKNDYDAFMNSGLYKTLTEKYLLVSHEEMPLEDFQNVSENPDDMYRILKPEIIPFISYPYEWCFSQLKDAALLTIDIELKALEAGMTLKDASAYNIQFFRGRPIFIDSLSFKKYTEGGWDAYGQFCRHFLAPLALTAYKDPRLGEILARKYLDGVPLDLAAKLLPFSTKMKPGLYMHLCLHAKLRSRYENPKISLDENSHKKLSKNGLKNILGSLQSTVENLRFKNSPSQWKNYYSFTNYSEASFSHKKKLVKKFIDITAPSSVWDIGANDGTFSRLAAAKGAETVSFDIDFNAVESNYLRTLKEKETKILPLIMDITNPSPALGWENKERNSLFERGNAEMVLALALIHHIAISNNVPLSMTARVFARLSKFLIIEWVPKEDSQTKKILEGREDIFNNYNIESFEKEFSEYFYISEKEPVTDSLRVLYLMKNKRTFN